MSSVPLESAPVPEYFSLVEDLYLGRPDLAETYADMSEPRLVVVPFMDLPHDYAYSEALHRHGLSNGEIFRHHPTQEEMDGYGAEERDAGIAFAVQQDVMPIGELITASLNSQLNSGLAQQNLRTAFDRIGSTLLITHQLTGEVPRDLTIDSICISRANNGHVEFMPPYTTTRELSPYDVVQNMRREVLERRVTDVDSGKPDFDLTPGLRNFLGDHLGNLALRIRNDQIEK